MSTESYIEHVALHLATENHRLFMMADMILQNKADQQGFYKVAPR